MNKELRGELLQRSWRERVKPRLENITAELTNDLVRQVKISTTVGILPNTISALIFMEGFLFAHILRDEFDPFFPSRLLQKWYPYAPNHISTVFEVIRSGNPEGSLLRLAPKSTKVAGTALEWGKTVTSLFLDDRTGFKLVDFIAFSPDEIARRQNTTTHSDVVNEIITFGAMRYKTLYQLATKP